MAKHIRNLFAVFVPLLVLDALWHTGLFGGFYTAHLVGFTRSADGQLAGLIPFMMGADLLAALGFSLLVTKSARESKSYLANALLFGVAYMGFFSLANHALLAGWDLAVVGLDMVFVLVASTMVGLLLKLLNERYGAPA